MIWIAAGAFTVTGILLVLVLWSRTPRATRIDYTPLPDHVVEHLIRDPQRRDLQRRIDGELR